MLGIVYKDIAIMKKDFIIILLCIVGFSLALFYPLAEDMEKEGGGSSLVTEQTLTYVIIPLLIYGCMYIVMSVLQTNLFEHDEREIWMCYIVSTPILYKGYVLSKYIESIALSVIIVGYGVICDHICRHTTGVMGSAWKIYVIYFVIQTFLRAFEYPFIFRFGQKYGKVYKVVLLSSIAYLGGVYALFGKMPDMDTERIIKGLMDVLSGSGDFEKRFNTVLGVSALVIVIVYYVSYKISCVMVKKRGVEV